MSLFNDAPNSAELEPRPARLWLLVGGWLLFALGLIGIALPLLPTTVFWIGAVWCWSRSAPRLSHRILSHPRFGQPVHRFIEYGMISRPGKWMALSGMAIGYLLLHLFGHPDWILTLSLGFILLLVGVWLWQRPEPMMSSQSQQHAPTFTDLSETPSSAPQRRSCDCPPTD